MNNIIKSIFVFSALITVFVLMPLVRVEAQTSPSYCQGASIYASPSSGAAPLSVSIGVDAKTYLKCIHDNALEYFGLYGMRVTYTITNGSGETYNQTYTYSAYSGSQSGSGPDWDQFTRSFTANTSYGSSGNFTVGATVRVESWGWACGYSSGCFSVSAYEVGRSVVSTGVSVSSVPPSSSVCTSGPGGYTKCSDEGGNCTFSGQASVAYGCNGSYNYQTHTNSVSCSNNQFGDPLSGQVKACFYQSIPSATLEVHVRDHSHNLIGTATYSVSPQVGGGSGGFDSYTITPSPGGTQYNISLSNAPVGWTYTHTGNSDGNGTSMTVFPGQTKQFTLYFIPSAVYGCTDPSANNYNPSATVNQGCTYNQTNNASIVSYNVPGSFTACETRQVSVTMQNTGTKTWVTTGSGSSGDYNLGAYNNVWGHARQSTSGNVSPGQQKTFTWNATAPCSPGTYSFQWRMVEEMVQWFGQELNLNISVVGQAPTVSLSANPSSIFNGEGATLSWSSSNASSCSGSGAPGGWNGNKPTSGTHSVSPNSTITYTITCSGSGGSASDSKTITVSNPPTPTASISSSPSSIIEGQSSTISWSSTNATSCSGSGAGGWNGNKSTSGSQSVSPGSNTTYVISCSGLGGTSAPAQTTVNVSPAFNYSLSNSGNVSVMKGGIDQYGTTVITKTLSAGSTQGVNLSASGQPSGVSISFSGQGGSPTSNSTASITVGPDTVAGTYPITVTGSPLGKTTSFNLTVTNSPALIVSCSASPTSVQMGENVTWTGEVSGGVPPYVSYTWSGSGVPTNPAPSTNPFSISYSTVGSKTARLTVRDSLSNQGTCGSGGSGSAGSVMVNFDPTFEEF